MKVLDMMNKIDDLKSLRDNLQKRINADDVIGNDSDLMYQALEAIWDYIQELYKKEVKV